MRKNKALIRLYRVFFLRVTFKMDVSVKVGEVREMARWIKSIADKP